MKKHKLRNEAIKLRVEGNQSLSEISKQLGISKSTASLWLKSYPLNEEVKKAKEDAGRRRVSKVSPSAMGTIKKGAVAELIFQAACLSKGLDVFSPVTADGKIDMIISNDHGKLYRIQVKALSPSKCFSVRKTGCNSKTNTKSYVYSVSDIDIYAIVNVSTCEVYIIPVEALVNYTSTVGINVINRFKDNWLSMLL